MAAPAQTLPVPPVCGSGDSPTDTSVPPEAAWGHWQPCLGTSRGRVTGPDAQGPSPLPGRAASGGQMREKEPLVPPPAPDLPRRPTQVRRWEGGKGHPGGQCGEGKGKAWYGGPWQPRLWAHCQGAAAFEARGGPAEKSSGEYLMLSWTRCGCREAPGSCSAYFLLLPRTEPAGGRVAPWAVGSQPSISPPPSRTGSA